MVRPDLIEVLIEFLIEKGIIENEEEWNKYYYEYMKNMSVNLQRW